MILPNVHHDLTMRAYGSEFDGHRNSARIPGLTKRLQPLANRESRARSGFSINALGKIPAVCRREPASPQRA
jgi:hypothetical protein